MALIGEKSEDASWEMMFDDETIEALRRLAVKDIVEKLLGETKLTKKERRVIELLYFEGWTVSEAAKKMRLSPQGVNQLHTSALVKLLLTAEKLKRNKRRK